SQRRTVLYLYSWTLAHGAFAVALRFVPYHDDHGNLQAGWSIVMGLIGLIVLAASVYLVYVLEILKFKGVSRRTRPGAGEEEGDQDVARALETGEFSAVS